MSGSDGGSPGAALASRGYVPGAAQVGPRLLPGEVVLRRFVADSARARTTLRRRGQQSTMLLAVGVGLFVVAIASAAVVPLRPFAGVAALGGFVALVVSRFRAISVVGLAVDQAPDEVYLTDTRVIVVGDRGTALEATEATARADVGEVLIWQNRPMTSADLTWVYIVPRGTQSPEMSVDGRVELAPGVVKVQNLSRADAAELQAALLGTGRGPVG